MKITIDSIRVSYNKGGHLASGDARKMIHHLLEEYSKLQKEATALAKALAAEIAFNESIIYQSNQY
jgi:molybdenum-dependent DNA-binding transcriptional regulator ModE